MEKQINTSLRDLRPFSEAIGDFIHYWGFRRIHGEIWAQVFLSNKPLSGAEIVKRLKVSKALVSPALKQLVEYKLIFQVESEDSREKLFAANSDFLSVIKEVLSKREGPMLQKIQSAYNKLQKSAGTNSEIINLNRLSILGETIAYANFALLYLQHLESFEEIFAALKEQK